MNQFEFERQQRHSIIKNLCDEYRKAKSEAITELEKTLDEVIELIKERKAKGLFQDVTGKRYVIDQDGRKVYIKK